MNQDKIGKFIKQQRTDKGLSQYQLADIIPISRQAISKWERGETIPDSSTLLRLSEIFDVTINELLKGERQKDNSIEQLQKTTLNIVDDSNKKTRKIKHILRISITIITLLVLSFLSYYFITSYNTIKVYTVSSKGENFVMYDGIFTTTKQKSFFKLGRIKPKNDEIEINNIKLYYKKGNKKILIAEDIDIDMMITEYFGYSETPFKDNLSNVMNNSYLEIIYNETEKETLPLSYYRQFTNSKISFHPKTADIKNKAIKTDNLNAIIKDEEKKEDEIKEEKPSKTKEKISKDKQSKVKEKDQNIEITEEKVEETVLEIEDKKEEDIYTVVDVNEKINIIKEKGIYDNGSYLYEADENIHFLYFEMMNQLAMYKGEETIWTYFVLPKIYMCEEADKKDVESCQKMINKCLNDYIN